LLPAGKARPETLSFLAVIHQDRTDIVKFV
jgi:hypothetical protein